VPWQRRSICPYLDVCRLLGGQLVSKISRKWAENERDAQCSLLIWAECCIRRTDWWCVVQLRGISNPKVDEHFADSSQEVSTYFPRKVLWRAFLCSLTAAVVLKALNPTGTGKLVLFETKYGLINPLSRLHLPRSCRQPLRWCLLQSELPLVEILSQILHY
jgi:hypothetical protein